MKALLLAFFVFAAAFNVPLPCAHALGLGDAATDHAPSAMTMNAEDHGAHGGRHEADTPNHHLGRNGHHGHGSGEQSHTNQHDGCAEGCDGGANCEGCYIVAGAVDRHAGFNAPAPLPSHRTFANITANSAASAAEPPPPRA